MEAGRCWVTAEAKHLTYEISTTNLHKCGIEAHLSWRDSIGAMPRFAFWSSVCLRSISAMRLSAWKECFAKREEPPRHIMLSLRVHSDLGFNLFLTFCARCPVKIIRKAFPPLSPSALRRTVVMNSLMRKVFIQSYSSSRTLPNYFSRRVEWGRKELSGTWKPAMPSKYKAGENGRKRWKRICLILRWE